LLRARFAFVLALLVAACGGGASAPDAGVDDTCGGRTCEANQYCVARCGPPESFECVPFSRSCDASNMCACAEIAAYGGICDAEARRVDVPCP
jgi:hypothetical protein